jgi:hypothetical protein
MTTIGGAMAAQRKKISPQHQKEANYPPSPGDFNTKPVQTM